MPLKQVCGYGIRIRIVSGSRRTKPIKIEKFNVLRAECSLWRAEGFSFGLDDF
jgi:hypothetical protein